MYHHVLLPVDLSDRHEAALKSAMNLVGKKEGRVTLLHVIELIAGLSVEEDKPFYHRLESAGKAHLAALAAFFEERSIACRTQILFGQRVAEILKYARAEGVDLIVLTAPPLDPSNLLAGWASMSHKIGLLAQCPVLLVK